MHEDGGAAASSAGEGDSSKEEEDKARAQLSRLPQSSEAGDKADKDKGSFSSSSSSSTSLSLSPPFTYEESRMSLLLKQEFERDGIHLPLPSRRSLSSLQNSVVSLETQFQRQIVECGGFYKVEDRDGHLVQLFGPETLAEIRAHADPFSSSKKKSSSKSQEEEKVVYLTTASSFSNAVLKHCRDGTIRRTAYYAACGEPRDNVQVLEKIVKGRHDVAKVLGYKSYADKVLVDKMAGGREEVKAFLEEARRGNEDKFNGEMKLLKERKRKDTGLNSPLEAWDLAYYMNVCKQEVNLDSSALSNYFSVEDCLVGLNLITEKLFGIKMVEKKLEKGEGWAPPSSGEEVVRKFDLVREGSGAPVGTIYFDLFPRVDKYTHAAHFTVRCGCKFYDAGTVVDQLPIVALVTNFGEEGGGWDTLLGHSEVETLFHEFGHALHSLLSRTKFQHLSGTRGPVDFVETPSHLKEYFCSDNEVLSKFAKHHITRSPIPEKLVKDLKKSKEMFSGVEKMMQCMYSEFDQEIFGPHNGSIDTSQTLKKLHTKFGLPYADGTCWHAKFGHLVTYGGAYYGYLWAQAIAGEIVGVIAKEGKGGLLTKRAGERVSGLITPGSSKNPFAILEATLERPWRPSLSKK